MQILDSTSNFLAIDKKYKYEESKIAILPAPYEFSTSYGKGADKGPEEILNASAYVEFYDDEFDSEICFDKGITTIAPIEFGERSGKEALDLIKTNVETLLKDDKFVITIGGEHTISIAPIEAHFAKYHDMSVLHFDAHSDLRQEYEDSPYSHACFMARVAEFFPTSRITQVGIRAQCKEEAEFIRSSGISTFYASAIRRGLHGEDWQKAVASTLGEKIYVTFDVDYFDPSIMPATGTPEPDGFQYHETLEIFREILKLGKKIIGLDVVELAPMDGLHHPNLTTARLIYKILNFAFNK
ncbi:MAG: Agmatinase [Ignavibacteria bacterium]|nr:Agmatinase [Ignavibacteria bacterium]